MNEPQNGQLSAAEAQLAQDRREWRDSWRTDLIEDYARPYPDAARRQWIERQFRRWFEAREGGN